MHKRLIAIGLLATTAATAQAEPYLGIGYQGGASKVENNALRRPVIDGRTLDASGNEWSGGVKLLAGYRLNDSWAVELGLRQAEREASFELRTSPAQDEEWESSIDAIHVTLAPVYVHRLGDGLDLRATAGLVYGDYDIKHLHVLDVENGPDQILSRATSNRSKIGGMVGLGVAVHTPWKLELLAEIQHQRTSILSDSSLAVTAVYRF